MNVSNLKKNIPKESALIKKCTNKKRKKDLEKLDQKMIIEE